MKNYKIVSIDYHNGQVSSTLQQQQDGLNATVVVTNDYNSGTLTCINENADLLVLDWNMNSHDALDTIKRVRQNEHNKHTFILLVAEWHDDSGVLSPAFEAGANDVIRKPINASDAFVRFTAALHNSSVSKQLNALLQQMANEKKQQKQRDLEMITSAIVRKNDALLKLRESLEEPIQGAGEEVNKRTGKLIKDIDNDLKQPEDWRLIKNHFQDVYEGFFDRLANHYPDLTNYDQKLCAFLRMDLSTKEIASLLNITVPSAEISRVRLRKKLDLGARQNLTKFIAEL